MRALLCISAPMCGYAESAATEPRPCPGRPPVAERTGCPTAPTGERLPSPVRLSVRKDVLLRGAIRHTIVVPLPRKWDILAEKPERLLLLA